MPDSRVLYRPEEVAGLLACGRSVIYELLRSGALPSVKLGRSRRVVASAVTEFVERLQHEQADGDR